VGRVVVPLMNLKCLAALAPAVCSPLSCRILSRLFVPNQVEKDVDFRLCGKRQPWRVGKSTRSG
jgi:hypothetical protein